MTSLDGVLSIASSGLAAIQGRIAVVSQNVANADTANYAAETVDSSSLDAGGQASGVRLGATTIVTAPALQTSLYAQNAVVAYNGTLSAAMSAVTSVEGSTTADTGSTGSLTADVTALQTGFTSLQSDPTSVSEQQTVVDDATSLASGIQSLATTYATQRQSASDGIGTSLATINGGLAQIGSISDQIVQLKAQGLDSANLENQRNAVMSTLSGALGVRFQEQSNGDMLVTTTSGLSLPTHGEDNALTYAGGTLSAASAYVAGSASSSIPPIMLDGVDVTSSLTGGAIGAQIELRDVTLPTDQAQLDSFSGALAQRFSAQGLTLFTDGNGNVPSTAATQLGFSNAIVVNPAVLATPALVATGTTMGASTTVAAVSAQVDNVVQNAFGTSTASGVTALTAGLGPAGNLTLATSGTGTLSDLATGLLTAQGEAASEASSTLSVQTAVQTSLQTSIGNITDVSTDSEMSKMTALENSYTANAKVIAAVQAMFTELLDAVNAS